MTRYVFILLLLIFTSPLFSQTISSIEFSGLRRTKESFLFSRIDLSIGDVFNEEDVKQNAQYLRNLNLFHAVEHSIDSSLTGIKITFIIEEARYVYPIISLGGFSGKFNMQLGVGDLNFRGKAQQIGFIYQYYDRHSFTFYQNALLHQNRKTGHEFSLSKRSTLEPLYFGNMSSVFNFDNYNISVGGFYWFNRFIRAGIGGMYMYEQYENRGSQIITPGKTFNVGDNFYFQKIQARAQASYTNINYFFERRNGFENTLFSEYIATLGSKQPAFIKVTNEFKYYQFIGKSGNLNLRSRIGLSTNNDSPFSPFVIDGFLNVRGSGDRVARGTGEFIMNLEYMHTVWRNKIFFLMVNTFADVGYLRPPGQNIATTFDDTNAHYFYGLGLRIQSRKFYNTTLRFDYGFSAKDTTRNGLTFGFGQFF